MEKWQVITIKCLFWNINRKNLVQELSDLVLENHADIVMAVEAWQLDVTHFISRLRDNGKIFEKKEMLQKQTGIMLLANRDIAVSVYKEEKYFSAYKVHENERHYLLVVTHLISAMSRSEAARNQRANDLSRTIAKLEEACNKEIEREGKQYYNTIVVGDFNLHPFSSGIVGMHGFHAIMDSDRALKKSRKLNGNEVKFYYNPMWHLMGKRGTALGTYFFESDQDDNSFYWYTFDQVLIRPELIERFMWDEFRIIDHIGQDSLIRNHRIDKQNYSDHLPIKFAFR